MASSLDRRWILAGSLCVILALLGALLPQSVAAAPSIFSAEFTAGGDVINGTRYATVGDQMSITVKTSNDVQCIVVSGAHEFGAFSSPNFQGFYTRDAVSTTWILTGSNLRAGAGTGPAIVTIKVGTLHDPLSNPICTGQTITGTTSYYLDNTPPTITPSFSPQQPANGWWTSPVTVNWQISDTGAGVNGPAQASTTVSSSTSASGTTVTYQATDNVGNTGTGSATVKVDVDAPSISANISPSLNAAGWSRAASVAVNFTCNDPHSGVNTCTGNTSFSAEGVHTANGNASDVAGNTASKSATVRIDRTAPVLIGQPTTSPNAAGWHNANVTVNWTCSDPLSGLATACPSASAFTAEGRDQTVNVSVSDKAGNTANGSGTKISIDKTPPTTTATPGTFANGGVPVSFNATDGLSGVAATYYRIGNGSPQQGTNITVTGAGNQTVEYWSVDTAGNEENHQSLQVVLDTTPPTIVPSFSPAPNAAGWNNSPVTVTFVCDDASGIAACTAPQTISTEGANQPVHGEATDKAGYSASTDTTVSIDLTLPTISGAPTTQPNAAGWYNGDVAVAWACADALSGLAAGACPANSTIATEGASQTASTVVSDRAGNQATGTSAPAVKIDRTAPTTSATIPPWSHGTVGVTLTPSDALSGVVATYYKLDGGAAQTDTNLSVTGEGSHGLEYWSVDAAGNEEAHRFATVSIDTTAPTLTPSSSPVPTAHGWHNGDVTVTFTCADQASNGVSSGVATCAQPQMIQGEGANLPVHAEATDNAGNTGTLDITVNIDRTLPTISGAPATQPNAAGWYNGDVSITWTCADALSGLAPGACPASSTITAEGEGLTATAQVSDKAGNQASATSAPTVKIDRTAPTTGTNAPTSWSRSAVNVTLTATDGLSGVAATYFKLDGGAAQQGTGLTVTGEGAHSLEYWSVDAAGNEETHHVAQLSIDLTAPTIVPSASPVPNAAGWHNGDVTVTFTCADPTSGGVSSGVATCTEPQTITVEGANQPVHGAVTDNAGNTNSADITVSIDRTAPTISGAPTTQPNAAGWYNGDVPIAWTCADTLSGIAPGACPANSAIAAEGEGLTANASVADRAGNQASATSTPAVKIDRTAPTTTAQLASATMLRPGVYLTAVTVTLSASDGLSGVGATYYTLNGGAAQPYSGPFGFSADSSYTIAFWSTDLAGNVATSGTTTFAITSNVITFPTLATPQIYGAAPLALAATATSGLPVTYETTGPCRIAAGRLALTGAGACIVTAQQAGDSTHSAATPVAQTVTIQPAPLLIVAKNQSRPYGSTALPCAADFQGLVNGDASVAAMSGTPACATTATASSPIGTYPLTIGKGSLNAANYTLTYKAGMLTIDRAVATLTGVGGSGTYGSRSGTLSATLTRVSGDRAPVVGATVIFTIDGVAACGSAGKPACPKTGNDGVATLATTLLPAGLNAGTYANRIGASFAGDAAYTPVGSTTGALQIARAILSVKAQDRTVGLKQPNPSNTPPANCLASATATRACWLELANGSNFVNGDSWSALNFANLRFQYSRNPVSTNATEKVGSTYRITVLGASSSNYDIRYDQGTLTVVAP